MADALLQLAQSFKEIKAKGVAVIQKMSTDISKKAQEVSSNESKEEFVDACEPLKDIHQVRPLDPRIPSLTVPSPDWTKGNYLRSR